MYLGHPALTYILVIYSIVFIIKSKTRNEFLLLFTIFCFLESMNSWENSIISIMTVPINFRVIDIPLLILAFYVIKESLNKNLFYKIFITSKLLFGFILFVFLYTFIGMLHFGYASIAEFRLIFFYIIVVLFIISNVKNSEILYLIRKIAQYLIPLILLVPINILLTGNLTISVGNRALGAFIYESITLGYIAGYFYWSYTDDKFKIFKWFLPIFLISSIWANVRTVWAIIIAATFFIIIIEKGKMRKLLFLASIFIIIALSMTTDINYLEERTTAFTNISADETGQWRLLVWDAVIRDATFLGEGIGARFKVYADVIGFAAESGAHNGFIQILHNLGYLGVFVIILLFISFIAKFLNAIQKTSTLPHENMIYKLSLISVFSLTLYMMGYGADLMSWIFISFGLKLNFGEKGINSPNYRISNA